MGTIKTPMRFVGSYFDPAKIESLMGGTKLALILTTVTTIIDAFTDNSLDLTIWTEVDPSGKVNEQNGRLEIVGVSAWNSVGISSIASYARVVGNYYSFDMIIQSDSQCWMGLDDAAGISVNLGLGIFLHGGVMEIRHNAVTVYTSGAIYTTTNVINIKVKFNATGYAVTLTNSTTGTVTTYTSVVNTVDYANYYFQFQVFAGTYYYNNCKLYSLSYDSSSPPIYTVFDNSIVGAVSDMSTFANRGDNVNGETGSVKYKYFFSDTLYDPTNAGDLVTIIAGLNASWLTEAQMQAVGDPTSRYRYLAQQLISDGTQTCSQVECSDLMDVVLPAAAGGGGAWVF